MNSKKKNHGGRGSGCQAQNKRRLAERTELGTGGNENFGTHWRAKEWRHDCGPSLRREEKIGEFEPQKTLQGFQTHSGRGLSWASSGCKEADIYSRERPLG